MNLKTVAAQWKALSAAQKASYVAQAKKNLAKRQATRKTFKKPPTKYALFVKKNFPAAYAAALKQTTNKKNAFKIATKAVAQKYKA